ncbi:MAG: hypothetical protein COB85_01975 [Bacteroidetes bacterium]|nr:MAG: hypothetical protein COB85_01975 [Bacteroidota bacterium]
MCAGSYIVTVTDNNNCSLVDTAVITEPLALANAFTSTDVLCSGDSTGVATANITGGTTAYTYLWDDLNLQVTNSATGLIAGTYTVLVSDANGCTLSDVIAITEPAAIALVVDTNGANCGLPDGDACVTVSAGISPFTYLWGDSGAQTNACATGLLSGTYGITVTDNTGCTAIALAIVDDLGAPTLSISAFGNTSCKDVCDGFATVLVSNGDAPYTYTWNDPDAQTTAQASGLCDGVFIVNIVDSNGCTGSISATITEPPLLSVVISGQTPTTCNGDCDGTASALASGGTGSYTYQWNDVGTQTTQIAVGLCAGSYGLTVIDANGCTDTTSVVIIQPDLITLTMSAVDANCGLSDGSAFVIAVGGNGLYGYSWNPSGITANPAQNIPADNYTVTVTDVLGC